MDVASSGGARGRGTGGGSIRHGHPSIATPIRRPLLLQWPILWILVSIHYQVSYNTDFSLEMSRSLNHFYDFSPLARSIVIMVKHRTEILGEIQVTRANMFFFFFVQTNYNTKQIKPDSPSRLRSRPRPSKSACVFPPPGGCAGTVAAVLSSCNPRVNRSNRRA